MLSALYQAGLSREESAGLERIRKELYRKQKNMERQGRLLQIGIMGQIKSGKSSFLNALLFQGREVLPKAATPKTAQLTRISRGIRTELQVSFYSREEWNLLEQTANASSSPEQEAALELVSLGKSKGERAASMIGAPELIRTFDSSEQLSKETSDFIGEEGDWTPFVKSVEIRLPDPALEGLVIVDTPGLNDRIYFHTQLTQRYIEQCDVIFFLSPASDFLDRTDAELLLSQLPAQGVGRLVLVASKYDSGLMDTIWDKGCLADADRDTRLRLIRQTQAVAATFDRKAWRENQNYVLPQPLFLSVMAHQMAQKPVEKYDQEELRIWEGLSIPNPPTREQLEQISHFQELQEVFLQTAEEKIRLAQEKQRLAQQAALQQWEKEQHRLTGLLRGRLRILTQVQDPGSNLQKEQILRLREVLSQGCAECFSQLRQRLEQSSAQLEKEFTDLSVQLFSLEERQGIRSQERTEEISAAKWYKPWTWGKTQTQKVVWQESYRYYDVAAAAGQLRKFLEENAQLASSRLEQAAHWESLRLQLLKVCLPALNGIDSALDPAQLKAIAQEAVNGLSFPPFHLNIQLLEEKLIQQFGQQATGGNMKALQTELEQKAKQGLSALKEISQTQCRQVMRLALRRKGMLSQRLEQALNRELSWMEHQETERQTSEDHLRKTLKLLQEKINCA